MRVARATAPDGRRFLCRIDGQSLVPIVAETGRPGADPLREALADGIDLATARSVDESGDLATWRLLSPVAAPQKIVAIGLNYHDHARESGLDVPTRPLVFAKLPNSICGPDDDIRYSKDDSTEVDYEAELAVVIGRQARHVSTGDALGYVFGYTACNDVSARDAQFADVQWIRGKSFDTFCPLGPWIVTADEIPDPQVLAVRCYLNGTVMQDGTTREMVFSVAELVSYLSRVMTLEPGDVIATGTPYGVGFARQPPVYLLQDDVVEIEIEGIGRLRNRVVVD